LWKAGFIKPVVGGGGSFDSYAQSLVELSDRSVVGRIVLTV